MNCNHHHLKEIKSETIIQSKYKMIEMQEAFEIITSTLSQNINQGLYDILDINNFIISEENFLISYEDIYAPIDLPQCNTSTMDGYALSISKVDLTKQLQVIGKVYTDSNADKIDHSSDLNIVYYITTGAPVPSHCDTVVPIEYFIQIEKNKIVQLITDYTIKEGSFIRRPGSDISKGELLVSKGKRLTLNDLTILASVGISEININKSPTVGILSTGDEISDLKSKSQSGIIDTNKIFLRNILATQFPFCKVVDYGICSDDMEKVEQIFTRASKECNILISSGGVSMGDKDKIKLFLEDKGKILFGRLNMKPGKPSTFGLYNDLYVFGLPGNPVSCTVCYHLLVCYALKIYIQPGVDHTHPSLTAVTEEEIKSDIERPEYARGRLNLNSMTVTTTGSQQSSRLRSCQDFNCLIYIPSRKGNPIKKGEKVKCLLLSDNLFLEHQVSSQQDNLFKVGTITISDRAHKNEYQKDESSIMLMDSVDKKHFELFMHEVIPDDEEMIRHALTKFVNRGCDLILTSGGTGLGKRDVTHQVTKRFVDKRAKGIETMIIMESMKFTKFACLSNPIVGVKCRTLIINLPGKPKAIKENMQILDPILLHVMNQVKQTSDFH